MAIDYKKEGKLAIFTVDRPQVGNALSVAALEELHETMIDFRDDPELLVGIVTGAGDRFFSCGADVSDTLQVLRDNKDITAFKDIPMRGLDIWKPLIAAINGAAVGGGLELALACDIRITSENARFGTREPALGLIPGWGGTQRLPRVIPRAKAAELLIMGTLIDAAEAYRIGLVNKVVPLAELMPTAREWADIICQNAPLAVRAAKEAMIRGTSMTLEEGLQLEAELENYLLGTSDFAEGIAAFQEKRKPNYQAK